MDGATQQYERDTPEWNFRCSKCNKETSIPLDLLEEEPRICLECAENREGAKE